ncbi:MAG: hypothetical protein IKU94_06800 [Bacteroidaceae bacterium]|nr:hypothetical protein [Bacteroidaceae bacterium]
MHDIEGIVRQYDIDTLHITLNEELGLGYDRIMRLTEKWMANQKKYRQAVNPQAYVEADVMQEHLDRRLALIASRRKKQLIPFKRRYPNLTPVIYDKRRKNR